MEPLKQGRLAFNVAMVCDKGGREVNEDAVIVEQDNHTALFAVADGLGAHGGGDIASQTAVDAAVKDFISSGRLCPRKIRRVFSDINKAVLSKQTEEIQMKTTLAVVVCSGRHLFTAHLGDTRVYIFRDNNIVHITADHSLSYEQVMQKNGTFDDIRVNPYRHILRAALGVGRLRLPDIYKTKAAAGMAVLICSDGFWQYVDEKNMCRTLSESTDADTWLGKMLICHSKNAERFHDNYSAVCLRIKNKEKESETVCSIKA